MSFREIRNLVEHLRALGFTRLVSFENFTTPNFPLVAEILNWTMKMVEADIETIESIDCEQDRVILIRMAAAFFYEKLGLRLNTMRLYGADKLAARELLKITTCLYEAIVSALDPDTSEEELSDSKDYTNIFSGKELREVRQLASSIVMDAAALHDNLSKETDNKIKRQGVLAQGVNVDSMEASVIAALHSFSAAIQQVKDSTEQLQQQRNEIEEKISKKKESLTRKTKRLEALKKIKPTWQSELEQEESELRVIWEEYITKHQNLYYLEGQLQDLEIQQQQQLQDALTAAATRRKESKVTKTTGVNGNVDGHTPAERGCRRYFGTMTGEGLDSSSEDSFLMGSESDDDGSVTLSSVAEGPVSGRPARKVNPIPYLQKEPPMETSTTDSLLTKPFAGEAHGLSKSLGFHPSYDTVPKPKRPSSGRPKSARSGSRVGSWSVKGSGRVSPLSASDNSDEEF